MKSRGMSGEFGPAWSASLRRGTDAELRGWVETALVWCDETDAIAMGSYRRNVAAERKPDLTFVTEADRGIERLLRDRISAAFAGHGVVGEEYGTDAGGASVRWIVDPIDGTHNYIRGVPLFGTLLAVERDGELQAAVLSAPALRERWWARRGGGAWARGLDDETPRQLRVSRVSSLADAQILYGSSHEIEASGLAPGFRSLLGDVWRERGFGDFWGYALLAGGAAEAMVEVGLSTWDAAAPLVLVEEAGGRATDFDGRRAIDSGSFVVSNGILHDEILDRLRAGGRG